MCHCCTLSPPTGTLLCDGRATGPPPHHPWPRPPNVQQIPFGNTRTPRALAKSAPRPLTVLHPKQDSSSTPAFLFCGPEFGSLSSNPTHVLPVVNLPLVGVGVGGEGKQHQWRKLPLPSLAPTPVLPAPQQQPSFQKEPRETEAKNSPNRQLSTCLPTMPMCASQPSVATGHIGGLASESTCYVGAMNRHVTEPPYGHIRISDFTKGPWGKRPKISRELHQLGCRKSRCWPSWNGWSSWNGSSL